jgi:hypothetical protein
MQFCLLSGVPPQLAPLSSVPVGVCGALVSVQEAARSDKAMKLQRTAFDKVILKIPGSAREIKRPAHLPFRQPGDSGRTV